ATQHDLDGAAELGTLDIVEAQPPQPAVVGEAGGGDEVEVVLLLGARIPGAVLAALHADDAGVDRGLLELDGAQVGDVAEVEQAEPALARVASGGGAEPEHVALLG